MCFVMYNFAEADLDCEDGPVSQGTRVHSVTNGVYKGSGGDDTDEAVKGDQSTKASEKLLFVHQEQWQQV